MKKATTTAAAAPAKKIRKKTTWEKRLDLSDKLRECGKYDEAGVQENLGNIGARDALVDLLGKKVLRKLRRPATRFQD